jgi:hypothetical protein
MAYLLPLLLLLPLGALFFFGGYLLRAILPRHHALQSRLTDDAIANYAGLAMKNVKGILGVLLVIYFLAVGFLYG